jgi:16S rRNA (uracil1498-N3)-methyltransferase
VTANQFFVSRLAEGVSRIVLVGEEHRHLAKAARVRPGESVWLFDGSGRRFLARVETVGEDRTSLTVLKTEEAETRRTKVVLAACLVEAKKFDAILEKASELGCSDVMPVESARSLKAPGERAEKKLERWKRISREAAKQCKSRFVTEVYPPRPLRELLREPPAGRRIFLSEHGGRPLRDMVTGAAPDAVVLLVGPTGGWTEGEERDIRSAGFEAASLGRRILKSETAALAGTFLIVHHWSD